MPIDAHTYAARRERVRRKLRELDLAALLVTLDANRYYLSGFELCDHQMNESSGCLIILPDGRDLLCTDPRYAEAAGRLWAEEDVFVYKGEAGAKINAVLKDKCKGRLGFEPSATTVDFYEKVSAGLEMVNADSLVASLRMIKDEAEIALLRASAALNQRLMDAAPGFLRPGVTEKELAWEIEKFFRNNGASGLSFDSIAAFGPNAALPHAIPGDLPLTQDTCVLIDAGCRLNDYCSDQTRTFWSGPHPFEAFQKTMQAVRDAQDAAIKGMRPGVPANEVYGIVYDIFESRGLDRYFTHGLGHGVGLQTHEAPSLNPKNHTPLSPGMVVTVEPGLYYPEWGGVRWEYMLLVTEEGAEILR